MHRFMPLVLGSAFLFFSSSSILAAETWTNVSLVDTACHAKVKDAPDTHTRACALQCANSGYGIFAADGTYLAFDKAGNEKALAVVKSGKTTDHLRVTVSGERKGNTLVVTALESK